MCKFIEDCEAMIKEHFNVILTISGILLIIIIFIVILFHYNINALDSTFGAFFGAGFAFILNYFHEKNRDANKNYMTLISVQHRLNVLLIELLQLNNFISSQIEKNKTLKTDHNVTDEAWEQLEWQTFGIYHNPSIIERLNLYVLKFILNTSENKKYLDAILLAEAQYNKTLFILKERNRLYELYLEKTEVADDATLFNIKLHVMHCGLKLFRQNYEYSKDLRKYLSPAVQDIYDVFNKTVVLTNSLFKNSVTLSLDIPKIYESQLQKILLQT